MEWLNGKKTIDYNRLFYVKCVNIWLIVKTVKNSLRSFTRMRVGVIKLFTI